MPLRKAPALSSNDKASQSHSVLVVVRSYLENEQLLHGLSQTLSWEASEPLGFLSFFFFFPSGFRSVLESITFQEAVLLFSEFPRRTFLCSQKTILSLQPAPKDFAHCRLIRAGPPRSANAILLLRAPCGPSLIPRARAEAGTS